MYGLCKSCKDNIITTNETDFNLNDKIVWPVWMLKKHEYGEEGNKKTSNKMVKAEREGSIQDLINATQFRYENVSKLLIQYFASVQKLYFF